VFYTQGMTTTTIERQGGTLIITTQVDMPTSPTHPISIPVLGEDYNTAMAVADLYERDSH
jgi:hypothetical protein